MYYSNVIKPHSPPLVATSETDFPGWFWGNHLLTNWLQYMCPYTRVLSLSIVIAWAVTAAEGTLP